GFAHFDGKRQLGAAEDLWGILVADNGGIEIVLGVFHHHFGAARRDIAHLVFAGLEYYAPEERRDCVVQVDVRVVNADQRLHGTFDEVFARLRQHRDRDVFGDEVVFDQMAHKREIGFAGRRESDLDLLVTHLTEKLKHLHLAYRRHGC